MQYTRGLIREVASHERDNLVVFYYITLHLTSGLIRVVASHQRDNLVVFYYITGHLTSGLIGGGNGG